MSTPPIARLVMERAVLRWDDHRRARADILELMAAERRRRDRAGASALCRCGNSAHSRLGRTISRAPDYFEVVLRHPHAIEITPACQSCFAAHGCGPVRRKRRAQTGGR